MIQDRSSDVSRDVRLTGEPASPDVDPCPQRASRCGGRVKLEPTLVTPPRGSFGLEDPHRRRPLVIRALEDSRRSLGEPVDVVRMTSWALRRLIE